VALILLVAIVPARGADSWTEVMFETRIQTYWDDADPAGRVYFAHFFRFVEYAETELFRAAGTERMKLYDEENIWMPRVESFARFLKPILAEEAVFVRLRARFKGEKTVRMEFEILSAADRSLLAEGYITAVCIDRQSSRSRALPPAMREVFARAVEDI
jgi:YbgC/YbaW family acyl-CoA thioester hydrolase